MKALRILAIPIYAVAIGVQVCVLAVSLVRLERRLQKQARDAADQHRRDLKAELNHQRERAADERDWGVN